VALFQVNPVPPVPHAEPFSPLIRTCSLPFAFRPMSAGEHWVPLPFPRLIQASVGDGFWFHRVFLNLHIPFLFIFYLPSLLFFRSSKWFLGFVASLSFSPPNFLRTVRFPTFFFPILRCQPLARLNQFTPFLTDLGKITTFLHLYPGPPPFSAGFKLVLPPPPQFPRCVRIPVCRRYISAAFFFPHACDFCAPPLSSFLL